MQVTVTATDRAGNVATTQAVAGVEGGPTLIFADGFETGDFTRWSSCQWTGRNDTCRAYNGTADYSATVVADPGDPGGRPHVARFELRDGDVPPFGGGERVEIAAPAGTDAAEGAERWIGFDARFDSTWPPDFVGWGVVHQWRTNGDDTGSGPVTLAVQDYDQRLHLMNPNPAPAWFDTTVGSLAVGQWRRYLLHVKFSTSKIVGFVELHVDGQPVVPLTYCQTIRPGFAGSNYLKFGIYRDSANTKTTILWLDNITITAP